MIEAVFNALEQAHELYLQALGREIAMLQRVAEHLDAEYAIADELETMRAHRAEQELRCGELRRILAEAM